MGNTLKELALENQLRALTPSNTTSVVSHNEAGATGRAPKRHVLESQLREALARIQAQDEELYNTKEYLRTAKEHGTEMLRQRDAAIEALAQVEWRGIVFGEQCGECLRTQSEGHNPTCSVGRVLHPSQPTPEITND